MLFITALMGASHYVEADNLDPFTVSIIKSATERWKLDAGRNYLVLRAYSDSSHFYLYVSAENKIQKQFLPTYCGVEVLLCGEKDNPYFTYNSLLPLLCNEVSQKDSLGYSEYPEWRICRHKDGSFCKLLTQLDSPFDDIHQIEAIARNYMITGYEIKEDMDRIYSGFEVEKQAEYIFGIDSLSEITHKFPYFIKNRKREHPEISRYIILNIVIYKNGYSEISNVEVSSGDTSIDSLAIIYFNRMLKDRFYPAELRGEKVNSFASVVLPTQYPKNQN